MSVKSTSKEYDMQKHVILSKCGNSILGKITWNNKGLIFCYDPSFATDKVFFYESFCCARFHQPGFWVKILVNKVGFCSQHIYTHTSPKTIEAPQEWPASQNTERHLKN